MKPENKPSSEAAGRRRMEDDMTWDPRSMTAGLVLEFAIGTLFGGKTTERRDTLCPSTGDAVNRALKQHDDVQERIRLSGELPLPDGGH